MTRNHQMPLRKVVKAINSIKVGDRVRSLARLCRSKKHRDTVAQGRP